MRDFFDRQESARRKTVQLSLLYVLAVSVIVFSVYWVVWLILFLYRLSNEHIVRAMPFWDPSLFSMVALVTLAVIIVGSIYKIRTLAAGGRAVAEILGGRLLQRNTADLDEKKLLNVVEEMSLASGVPVPDVYMLDREGGINAFAAGFGMNDAVICVTRGSAALLTREELQGVVAHEFSHILNSDTLINIRLMGLLHGILVIGLIGGGMLRGLRYARGRGAGVALLAGSALYVIGYTGTFFGKLIKSAVSRQREYLADASAVQFTRNPGGIAGALKKIGGITHGSILLHRNAPEASHMYFCEGIRESMFGLMDTHPPLAERILRIDPRFDGTFPRVEALRLVEPPAPRPRPPRPGVAPVFTGAMAAAMLANVGAPMQEHAAEARLLMDMAPEEMLKAAREPYGARALVYSLLMDGRSGIRQRQLEDLGRAEPEGVVQETLRLRELAEGMEHRVRLPLMDLSMPSLRRLSRDQYRVFKGTVMALIAADGKVSPFEYALKYLLIRRLDSHFTKSARRVSQIYSIRGLLPECSVVLSIMARVGHRDPEGAAAAFESASRLLKNQRLRLEFLTPEEGGLEQLEKALDRLALASPVIKRQVLALCLECLTHDRSISVEEGEFFRAVIEALDCPVPPWLSSAA